MTLLKIAQIGHPILRQTARDLTPQELGSDRWQTFIDALIETMRDANGAGLAAPQVHQSVRICAIEVRPNNPRYRYKPPIPLTVLVNARFEPVGEETFQNYEGCLSVPDLRGQVQRHLKGRVRFLNREGEQQVIDVAGVTAGTYQHEIDHLDGHLFVDRVQDPSTLSTWAMFDAYHRAEFVAQITDLVDKVGS